MTLTLCKPRPLDQWVKFAVFLGFVGLCLLAYVALVQPTVGGSSEYRLGADSGTYLELAELIRQGNSGLALISFSANLLGPVMLAYLLHSGLLIAAFNLGLLCAAIAVAGGLPGVDGGLFAVLLALDAETLVSVVTVNKEIFSLLSVVLFAKVVCSERPRWGTLGLALVFAVLSRWEQAGIMVVFLLLCRRGSFSWRYRKTALFVIVLLLGAVYPLLLHNLQATGFTEQGDTGGTITTLNALQAHFLYPVVVLPKIAMSLFGQLLSPGYFFGQYWTHDFHDLQNQFAVHLHTLAMLGVCVAAAVRGRLRVADPVVFFIAVYLVVTAVTPFIQPRYQYPVYGLLCLVLSRRALVPARSRGVALHLRMLPRRLWRPLRVWPARVRSEGQSGDAAVRAAAGAGDVAWGD